MATFWALFAKTGFIIPTSGHIVKACFLSRSSTGLIDPNAGNVPPAEPPHDVPFVGSSKGNLERNQTVVKTF